MAINIIEYNRSYKEELIEFILSIQKNEFNINIDRNDQPSSTNIFLSADILLSSLIKPIVPTIF